MNSDKHLDSFNLKQIRTYQRHKVTTCVLTQHLNTYNNYKKFGSPCYLLCQSVLTIGMLKEVKYLVISERNWSQMHHF